MDNVKTKPKKEKKKFSASTLIIILILLVGLSLLLYPTFSDYWNQIHQSYAVANYREHVSNLNEEEYSRILDSAIEYNKELYARKNGFSLNESMRMDYNNQLSVDESGIMATIEIPCINVSLPVYHGTGEEVLQVAVGHLDWSSLPTGGKNTHCVVSGHRGLPSAKLFTNLDRLTIGDLFMFNVLNETLTYEVDQILIVDPHDTSALSIVKDMDYCTLVTCTPYGINSHRMLVRGHRVDNLDTSTVHVSADALQIEPFIVAPVIAAPILLGLLISILIPKRKKDRGDTSEKE